MAIYDPAKPLLQRLATEIYQQPERLLEQTKIGKHLFPVYGRKALDGFDFDEKAAIDDKVGTERAFKAQAFKLDVDGTLLDNVMSTFDELRCQYRLIHAFKQPRPKRHVQFDRRIDDVGCNCLNVLHLRVFAPSREKIKAP